MFRLVWAALFDKKALDLGNKFWLVKSFRSGSKDYIKEMKIAKSIVLSVHDQLWNMRHRPRPLAPA